MRRTFAAMVGVGLLAWGGAAEARVADPFGITIAPIAPWWGGLEATDLGPFERPTISGATPRWYDGEADSAEDSTELALPCGLFPEGEPRLTLFTDPFWQEPPAAAVVATWHTDKRGEVIDYDQIPRRWDRPADYDAYRYPIAGWTTVGSGYDLDLSDELQRRGSMRAVGHGGVDLPQPLGTKITMIKLDHQLGDAKVVYIGPLFGNTVVTLHAVREGGERRHYVVLFGHLDAAAPALKEGEPLLAGKLVGFVGDSESPELVHLHLEARRLRDGVDPATLTASRILSRDATIVTDPRNVLPLKTVRSLSCKERVRDQRRAQVYGDLRLELEPSFRR
jgi:murein DD-endopeptidase MepM/ murein hydrolase activator NlpD